MFIDCVLKLIQFFYEFKIFYFASAENLSCFFNGKGGNYLNLTLILNRFVTREVLLIDKVICLRRVSVNTKPINLNIYLVAGPLLS